MLRNLLFIIGILLITSCDSEETRETLKRSYIVVNGDTLHVTRYDNSVLSTVAYVDGEALSAQGCAIKDNFLYRFYDRGYCKVFQIHDDYNLSYVKEFKLGSYSIENHGNCAQFNVVGNDTLLYIAGTKRKCYVELIEENKSTLLQTITLSLDLFISDFNIISGDDESLWAFGGANPFGELVVLKLRRPLLNEGDVILSQNDVLDVWIVDKNYSYQDRVWQGGKVYKGKLFFVFGSAVTGKKIVVYDIKRREIVFSIPLDDVVEEEPEDCEIINSDILLLVVYGGNHYYLIENLNKLEAM